MDYENIMIETGSIATLTIDRPKKLNALDRATILELHEAFTALDRNPEVRAIIITGAGEKAFVAGADIAEFSDFSVEQGTQLAKNGQELLFSFVENLATPVIAAINGYALGGGLELAMACHFRVAGEHAKMGLPEVGLGLIPGYGGTQRLPRLIGKGLAMELILTAGMIDAQKALAHGLVNYVVPQAELLPLARELAQKMANNAPTAIASAIKAVNAGFIDGTDGYASEVAAFGNCFGTADFQEGVAAFLEKRKADFPGH